MTPQQLFAKSAPRGRPALRLAQHLLDTEQVAVRLFGDDHRLGSAMLRFFKLRDDAMRFRLNLRVACLFHDVGKANAAFYLAVTTRLGDPQTLRHEHLSALFLHLPAVRDWLRHNPLLDVEAITAAVLSHHFKASEEVHEGLPDYRWCQPHGALSLELYLNHTEITDTLAHIAEVASLPPPPALPSTAWSNAPPWSEALRDGMEAARRLRRTLRKDSEAQRCAFVVALKVAVIVSDSVASGLVREGHAIEAWIDELGSLPSLTEADIDAAVLEPRIASIRSSGRTFVWHNFQELAARQPKRALLLAGCGAGKTLAAWRWARRQVAEHGVGRIIFLYPTRGTATEGFRDYVGAAPEGEAALLHGTSRFELEAMLRNPDDASKAEAHAVQEDQARLFALAYWSKRYFSATVDQFLAFLQHGYASTCLVPALADSALIIDEVHSFDRQMFEALVTFLKRFDLPVLCMTATLVPNRREQLEKECQLRTFPNELERAELRDLELSEAHPRYRLERTTDATRAFELAVQSYREGRRVLWVVNRVDECQRLARELAATLGIAVLCYHSRFRLQDRQDRHRATIGAFQQLTHASIAVTTQVCEMSLDLDADVLLTERAPPSSLVQRFGRANRHRNRGGDFRARLIVYAPKKDAPYTRGEQALAEQFLTTLPAGDISQRDLAYALEEVGGLEGAARASTALFEGGYYAVAGALRDSDEFSRPCVLDRDVASVLDALRRRAPYDGFVVPVPTRIASLPNDPRLPRFLNVVAGEAYDNCLGYLLEGVS